MICTALRAAMICQACGLDKQNRPITRRGDLNRKVFAYGEDTHSLSRCGSVTLAF